VETKIAQKKSVLRKKDHYLKSVEFCRLKLRRRGLSEDKIKLLEQNIRVIINNVFNSLDHD